MQFEKEKSFILDCLKAFVNGTAVSQARWEELFLLSPNWDWMIRTAQAGRILPFLIHVFKKEGYLTHLSKKDQMWLHSFLMRSEWENRTKMAEFKKVKHLFEKNSISFIPLKGIALTCLVYQKTPFRYMADMDLLIKESDLGKARNLLLGDGFVLSEPKNRWQAKAMMKVIGRGNFVKANTDVDLQWCPKFFVDDEFLSWDCEGAWQRAKPFKRLGENVFMLSAVDQILYLSLQILNDIEINVVYLVQLLDLALVIQKYQVSHDILSEKIAALGPSAEKWLSAFFKMVGECFFENKPNGGLSAKSAAFFEKFFESLLTPKPGFSVKEVLQSIQSPWERFLFVVGYFVPSQNVLRRKTYSGFFGKVVCYFDHWRKQCFSFLKILLRQ